MLAGAYSVDQTLPNGHRFSSTTLVQLPGSVGSRARLARTHVVQPCTSGVCSANGTCVSATDENANAAFTISSTLSAALGLCESRQPAVLISAAWMKQNIVGTVLLTMLVLWVPPCVYVWRKVS